MVGACSMQGTYDELIKHFSRKGVGHRALEA
jgi:hypothetical protein